jgi:hypothetical protein
LNEYFIPRTVAGGHRWGLKQLVPTGRGEALEPQITALSHEKFLGKSAVNHLERMGVLLVA